jgi:hypothetical protein
MLLVNVVELKAECDGLGRGRPNGCPQVRAAVTHKLEPLKEQELVKNRGCKYLLSLLVACSNLKDTLGRRRQTQDRV